jgi:hypothetical protein
MPSFIIYREYIYAATLGMPFLMLFSLESSSAVNGALSWHTVGADMGHGIEISFGI